MMESVLKATLNTLMNLRKKFRRTLSLLLILRGSSNVPEILSGVVLMGKLVIYNKPRLNRNASVCHAGSVWQENAC
jgi:hypothetical protein